MNQFNIIYQKPGFSNIAFFNYSKEDSEVGCILMINQCCSKVNIDFSKMLISYYGKAISPLPSTR